MSAPAWPTIGSTGWSPGLKTYTDTGGAAINAATYSGATGNGSTDDTVAINAAITAANAFTSASGVTDVVLPAGTYMTATTITVKANVRLRGAGRGVTTIKSTVGASSASVVKLTGSDSSLEDLTVDVNSRTNSIGAQVIPASTAERIAVRRCKVINSTNSAIRVDTVITNGVTIEDNVIDTCTIGIQVLGVTGSVFKDVTIRGNRFRNVGTNNIQVKGANAGEFMGVLIVGNILRDFQLVGTFGPIPIEAAYIDGLIVANNYIGATGTRGISTGTNNDMVISGNTILGQTTYAMEVGGGKRISITGNTVKECAMFIAETAAQIEDVTISGNSFSGTGLASTAATNDGIKITSGARRVQITGNVFTDWQYVRSAIRIGEATNDQDVTVSDNTFVISDANTSIIAVAIRNVARANVCRNQIKVMRNLVVGDDASDVINISLTATSTDIVVNDNDILYTGTVASATNHAGIGHGSTGAATLPGLVIRRNRIKAGQHGLRLGSVTSGDQIVEDNDARTCSSFATDATNAALVYKRTVRIFEASSVPTAGTWTQGDVVVNKAAAVGSPKGWRCTVSGTPGTWVSEGNL